MSPTKHWHMPPPTQANLLEIRDAVLALRGKNRENAIALGRAVGLRALFDILHGMRRWYGYNTGSGAWKIIPHREALAEAMDLSLPVGAYRGYHLPRKDATIEEGDVFNLTVTRNAGCSSWTMDRQKANLFSGASKKEIGVVVQLLDSSRAKAFIAPPLKTEGWFNTLYENTMGRSFRFKEQEYAIHGSPIRVEVVAVKR